MKNIKLYFLSMLIGLMIFVPIQLTASSHANHYTFWKYGFGRSFNCDYLPITSEISWLSEINVSIREWNSSSAKTGIRLTNNGSHKITSYNWGNTGWYGLTSKNGNIQLNNITPRSYRAEVTAHELGHALGLHHYNCNYELMRASGFKGSPTPSEGDINGVKRRW